MSESVVVTGIFSVGGRLVVVSTPLLSAGIRSLILTEAAGLTLLTPDELGLTLLKGLFDVTPLLTAGDVAVVVGLEVTSGASSTTGGFETTTGGGGGFCGEGGGGGSC